MSKRKGDRRLTGSTGARVTAFFLLVVSFVLGLASAAAALWMYGPNYGSKKEMVDALIWTSVREDLDVAESYYRMALEQVSLRREAEALQGNLKESLSGMLEEDMGDYFAGRNSSAELYLEGELVWSCYDGTDTPYVYNSLNVIPAEWIREDVPETDADREAVEEPEYAEYAVYLYVDPEFPIGDGYQVSAHNADILYELRGVLPGIALLCIVVFCLCFIFLMCSAGHKNGREGVGPGVLTELPLDLLTAAFGFVAFLGLILVYSFMNYSVEMFALSVLIVGALEVVWCTIFCMEFALRLKLGKFWRNTIIYRVLRLLFRGVKKLVETLVWLVEKIPLVMNVVLIFGAICVVELFGILGFGLRLHLGMLCFLWLLEKIVLFLGVLYIALVFQKLLQGSRAIARGDLSYHVDTSRMILDFKEHGENLNRIGEGIGKAVEERMKSEHLKTELITNVSHDLKTPLTSIINYADLIGSERLENEKVKEYAEVLLRQSRRLKKLLEDLVEASKATTGNLEVNLTPCDIGVMLSQAVGEYGQRFAEKQLELIVRQPEEAVRILADGRHLWRIFDNLFNNIYKYAQENSRVYLNVECTGENAVILFRNMSKYALELSPQELEERFVRGDKSRHMEGNGLGLSIAKSLTELQKGSMEIVTDGDLFKVILRFPLLQNES